MSSPCIEYYVSWAPLRVLPTGKVRTPLCISSCTRGISHIHPSNLPLPTIMTPASNDNVAMDDVLANNEKTSYVYAQRTAVLGDSGAETDTNTESYNKSKAARRLLFKCDTRLIPILGCLYLVSFLDRSNIANARLFGLETSLHMPATGFNTCLWIFYLPFVIVEIPSNLFMSLNKIKPNQWLAGAMLILGMLRKLRTSRCVF